MYILSPPSISIGYAIQTMKVEGPKKKQRECMP